MAERIDEAVLSPTQRAELFEGGVLWLHDNGTAQDIELDAKAATLLFDFLLLHQERLIRHRDARNEAPGVLGEQVPAYEGQEGIDWFHEDDVRVDNPVIQLEEE